MNQKRITTSKKGLLIGYKSHSSGMCNVVQRILKDQNKNVSSIWKLKYKKNLYKLPANLLTKKSTILFKKQIP